MRMALARAPSPHRHVGMTHAVCPVHVRLRTQSSRSSAIRKWFKIHGWPRRGRGLLVHLSKRPARVLWDPRFSKALTRKPAAALSLSFPSLSIGCIHVSVGYNARGTTRMAVHDNPSTTTMVRHLEHDHVICTKFAYEMPLCLDEMPPYH